MFYEAKHSTNVDLIKNENGTNFSFPAHLHNSFELISVTQGEMLVTVDKIHYTLTPGQAVLIFPNQVHALHTEHHSVHRLCIFSAKLVQAYGSTHISKLPVSNLFSPNPIYLDELWHLSSADDLLKIKGVLYCLCSEFNSKAKYRNRNGEKGDLLQRIFAFVDNNYSTSCSLSDLAKATSYHPVYLSRFFKQCTGLSFTDHVNRYRIGEATYMLINTHQKMIEIAFSCGFNSLRSFNRAFKSVTGMTPTQYRNR